MSTNEIWHDQKRPVEIDHQIDPSFGNQQAEALQSIGQLQQHEALDGQPQTGTESFDVAAAAVAASNDSQKPVDIQDNASGASETGDSLPLGRSGKPLTNTKRAKQNRLAQRAFRQRKEAYIKELEVKSKEVELLKQTIEDLRDENNQLRDYSLTLQAKLIEQSTVPTPPAIFSGRVKKN